MSSLLYYTVNYIYYACFFPHLPSLHQVVTQHRTLAGGVVGGATVELRQTQQGAGVMADFALGPRGTRTALRGRGQTASL